VTTVGRKFKRAINVFWLTFLGVLASACGGIGSNAVYDMLKEGVWSVRLGVIALATLPVAALLVGYITRAAIAGFQGNRATQWTADKRGSSNRKAVIIMPSLLQPHGMQTSEQAKEFARTHPGGAAAALTEAISPSNTDYNRWSWQQALRLVQSFPNLKSICLIESNQVRAHGQGTNFRDLVLAFRPSLKIHSMEAPVSLTDYNEIEDAIYTALEHLHAQGFRGKDICIDITGGTKSFSAVAAIRSLNTDYVFSYVVTNQDTENVAEHGKVYLYDASVWSRRGGA
jgi:hypothetical protein